jgi:clan AA aspartic protease (TIGR02281 family)
MGTIYCRCSGCGATLKVDLEIVAPDPKCPRCSTPLAIPGAPGEKKLPVAKPLDDEPDFPHIATDAPARGVDPGHGVPAAGRGRQPDRTFRLAVVISAVSLVLLTVVVGAFAWLTMRKDSTGKPRASQPSAPAASEGPKHPIASSPAKPQAAAAPEPPGPGRSTLVLDWPTGERSEAVVFVDGDERAVPSSGDASFETQPGEHTVLIQRRGYEPIEIHISFEAGGRHHYRPEWKEAALAQVDPGKVRPEEPEKPTPTPEKPAAKPGPEPEKPAPKPAPAADIGNPEEFLAAKGLRRLSTCFSLPAETQVSDKLREADALRRRAFNADDDVEKAQKVVDEKKRLMLTYVQQSRELGAKLQFARTVDQHNQIVTALNEVESRILLLRESNQEEKALDQARAAATEVREKFIETLLELRRMHGEVSKQYEALAADPTVAKAIEQYGASASKAYRLGPTTTFAGMDKKLARLEKMVLSEAIPLRRGEGGLWYLTAVFNGQKPQEMAIDTGASVVALPWEVAATLGLAPGENDPGMLVEVADGRTVEAKRVLAETVRVGKFTAKNVECAVMPGGLPNTTPLLGLSFFKHFSFKIDSAKGQLVMSQMEKDGKDD